MHVIININISKQKLWNRKLCEKTGQSITPSLTRLHPTQERNRRWSCSWSSSCGHPSGLKFPGTPSDQGWILWHLCQGQQLANFQSFRKVMLGTEKCENLAELWRTGLFLIPAQASTFLPHPVTSLLFPNCLFQLSSITLLLPWASFYKHFQLWPQVGRECFTYKNSHTHTHTHTHMF